MSQVKRHGPAEEDNASKKLRHEDGHRCASSSTLDGAGGPTSTTDESLTSLLVSCDTRGTGSARALFREYVNVRYVHRVS